MPGKAARRRGDELCPGRRLGPDAARAACISGRRPARPRSAPGARRRARSGPARSAGRAAAPPRSSVGLPSASTQGSTTSSTSSAPVRARELAIGPGAAPASWPLRGVELATRKAGAERPQQLDGPSAALDMLGRHAPGRRPASVATGRLADGDRDRRVAARGRGRQGCPRRSA